MSQHDDLLVNEFDDSVGHGDDVTTGNAGKEFSMDPVIPTGWHIARVALFLIFILWKFEFDVVDNPVLCSLV